jgi:hypothetical protein
MATITTTVVMKNGKPMHRIDRISGFPTKEIAKEYECDELYMEKSETTTTLNIVWGGYREMTFTEGQHLTNGEYEYMIAKAKTLLSAFNERKLEQIKETEKMMNMMGKAITVEMI